MGNGACFDRYRFLPKSFLTFQSADLYSFRLMLIIWIRLYPESAEAVSPLSARWASKNPLR